MDKVSIGFEKQEVGEKLKEICDMVWADYDKTVEGSRKPECVFSRDMYAVLYSSGKYDEKQYLIDVPFKMHRTSLLTARYGRIRNYHAGACSPRYSVAYNYLVNNSGI